MATTTNTVGETITRTAYVDDHKHRGLYWGLAVVAIIVITLAAIMAGNRTSRTTVNEVVQPPAASTQLPATDQRATDQQFNGAARAPTMNDTDTSRDLPATNVPVNPDDPLNTEKRTIDQETR